MIFSSGVEFGKCTDCGHEVGSASSTSVLYFIFLVAIAVGFIMPHLHMVLEPAWWQWPVVILMEIALLAGSVMIWEATSRLFRESMQKCSECGGQIEIAGSGFHHSFLPSIDDVVIGLLYVGIQAGILFALLRLSKAS
jgi:uncharacterized protein (DUF983 family)